MGLTHQENEMNRIEKLGSWILDTRSGLIFGCLLMLGTLGYGIGEVWKAPKQVTLSEKDFTCVASEPHGLATRCTEYRRIK